MHFLQSLFSPDAWQLLGRFHVIIIHFPIALLLTVAIVEALSLLHRKTTPPRPSPAAHACLLLGTLSAIAAATTGWAHADYTTFPDMPNYLFYHRWLGIASAAFSLILLTLFYLARSGSLAALRRYQLASFLTAILVGITGHLGGTLTHGPDYLTITPPPLPTTITPRPATSTTPKPSAPTTEPSTTTSTAPAPDFTQAQLLFSQSCYFCHGPMRQRGNLRLDSLDALLTGGKSGPAIIPGNSQQSLLIHRLLGLDGKPQMPSNHPPLPPEQIQLLRNWIDSLPPTLKPSTPPTAPAPTTSPH